MVSKIFSVQSNGQDGIDQCGLYSEVAQRNTADIQNNGPNLRLGFAVRRPGCPPR